MKTSQFKSRYCNVKRKNAAVVSAIAMGLVSLATCYSAAAATNVFGSTGATASAWFSNSDGCGYSYLYLSVSENMVRNPPGPTTATSGANISLSEYNWCTGSYRYAYGWSNDMAFSINSGLNHATLKGSIPVWEYGPLCPQSCSYNVSVEASWEGSGELSRQTYNSHYSYGGYRNVYSSKGNYRDALASVAVTGDSLNMNETTSGNMGISQSHTITVNMPN